MIIRYWDQKAKKPIQDNRMLEQVLGMFVEKKVILDRVLREIAIAINSDNSFYVIREASALISLGFWNEDAPGDNKLWYCYTAFDRVKIDFFREHAIQVKVKECFSRALDLSVDSILLNPSAVSCACVSANSNNNEIKRVLTYAKDILDKEYHDLAAAYSEDERFIQVVDDQAIDVPTSIERILESSSAESNVLLVDTTTNKFYELTKIDREKISKMAAK